MGTKNGMQRGVKRTPKVHVGCARCLGRRQTDPSDWWVHMAWGWSGGYLGGTGTDVEQQAPHFVQADVRSSLLVPQLQTGSRGALHQPLAFSPFPSPGSCRNLCIKQLL